MFDEKRKKGTESYRLVVLDSISIFISTESRRVTVGFLEVLVIHKSSLSDTLKNMISVDASASPGNTLNCTISRCQIEMCYHVR